ncbi:MAG: hypothetical protein MUE44_35660 [Oscillatoriaceae cyanobacterium Prado104]|nr:hypothetical protein [Oscillatoriaceae cyanobacterium Prado104]
MNYGRSYLLKLGAIELSEITGYRTCLEYGRSTSSQRAIDFGGNYFARSNHYP